MGGGQGESNSNQNKNKQKLNVDEENIANALHSFLQQDANEHSKAVDWENMSRGAYSTVSKMKTAVERMKSTNEAEGAAPAPGAAGASKKMKNKSPARRSKSDDGVDRLGNFLQKGNAKAKAISSDDRSRGAHSTMSHNLRRTKPQQKRSTSSSQHRRGHVPFHPASDAKAHPVPAAELKLPTGNPKSKKAQKNLELFMSRQQPLPTQDLEVRSAFTSVDRARKYTLRNVPKAPLPASKEDLVNLLRTSTSPNRSTSSKGVRASASSLSIDRSTFHVSTSTTTMTAATAAASAPKNAAEPTRGVQRTVSGSSAHKKKVPVKRIKPKKSTTTDSQQQQQQQQQEKWLSLVKSESFRTAPASPKTQFSNLLPARADLDKPQPIVPATPTDLQRSQSVQELATSSGSSSSSSPSKLDTPKSLLMEPDTNKFKPGPSPRGNSKGTARNAVRKDATDGSTPSSSSRWGPNNNNKSTAVTKKKPSPNTATDKTASKTSKTASQVMSARRLHHAPANSIPQSPIAGRRQSLKMGLAGTVSGDGSSRVNKTKKKKTATTATTTASTKTSTNGKLAKKPVRKNSSNEIGLPAVPVMTTAENETPPAAEEPKRRRPATAATDSSSNANASSNNNKTVPSGTPQRRKTSDNDEMPANNSTSTRKVTRPRRKVDENDNLEDVFSFYAWSASRQSEAKVQKERRALRETIMDGGPLHRAFQRL